MRTFILNCLITFCVISPAIAQVATQQTTSSTVSLKQIGMIIYPAKGQSAEQQQKDEAACTQWAQAQTGLVLEAGTVDTQAAAQAAEQQAGAATQGAAVVGGAKGALAGLAIGSISGNAGEGAAIGAIAGGILGRRARKHAEAEAGAAGAQQAQAQNQQAVDTFKKAAGACLEGRGYTVS